MQYKVQVFPLQTEVVCRQCRCGDGDLTVICLYIQEHIRRFSLTQVPGLAIPSVHGLVSWASGRTVMNVNTNSINNSYPIFINLT